MQYLMQGYVHRGWSVQSALLSKVFGKTWLNFLVTQTLLAAGEAEVDQAKSMQCVNDLSCTAGIACCNARGRFDSSSANPHRFIIDASNYLS